MIASHLPTPISQKRFNLFQYRKQSVTAGIYGWGQKQKVNHARHLIYALLF